MGQSFSFFSLKHHPPKQDPTDKKHQPGVFSKLSAAANKPGDFVHLISNCISAASTRTQEYLAFNDPEEKFHPSPRVLIQVFLMTYITQIFSLNVTDAFSCTVTTPEQRVLPGADWVWATLEKPSQNPKIQIVVQVLHLPEGEEPEETAEEANMEAIKMAQMESGGMNPHEKTVDFRASVGKDCFALFLLFGKQDDQENIYGVRSNNFEAAIAKGNKVDRCLIEHFFKGSSRFHTPLEIMQAVFSIKTSRPLTLITKFS
uniref:RAB15 effector protein n=1 Tax=Nothobranchius kadleci TaxID=1051664 RepID=A0A1A8CNF6_NOTKA